MWMVPCIKKDGRACRTGLQELHPQNRILVPLLGFFSKFSMSTPILSMWESLCPGDGSSSGRKGT